MSWVFAQASLDKLGQEERGRARVRVEKIEIRESKGVGTWEEAEEVAVSKPGAEGAGTGAVGREKFGTREVAREGDGCRPGRGWNRKKDRGE